MYAYILSVFLTHAFQFFAWYSFEFNFSGSGFGFVFLHLVNSCPF